MSTPTGTVTFLFTDVEGSTRLWEESREAMTLALARHDEIVRAAIEARGGYVFATGGDAFSAAFQRVSDAVEAAVGAQRALQAEAWPAIEFRVRMAVHVGEAEERDGDYFGPTLNRTARVLSTAAGNEILVSGAVASVGVESLPDGAELVDLGDRDLKDLGRSERVYRLTAPGLREPEARQVRAPSRDDEPLRRRSIAVLPFDVIGGHDHTEALADGLVEDVISALAASHSLPVTARNSTFVYKGRSVDVREAARDLGVHYVLEGSLRQSGDKIRVSAQLIDGTDGSHLWADHYDGELDDVFAFQDRITRNIAVSLDPAIHAAEARALTAKAPSSFDAWDHVVLGRKLIETLRPDEVEEAIGHLQVAIDLDPGLAEAYAWIANAYFFRGWAHWVDDEDAEYAKAIDWARRSLAIDPNNVGALTALALTYLFQGDYHRGRSEAEKALHINPNAVVAHFVVGDADLYSDGDPELALVSKHTCLQLDPHGFIAPFAHASAAACHYLLAEYDDAIRHCRDALAIRGGYLLPRVILAAGLARSGALVEARSEVDEILKRSPGFSEEYINQPFRPEHRADLLDGLRLAEPGG